MLPKPFFVHMQRNKLLANKADACTIFLELEKLTLTCDVCESATLQRQVVLVAIALERQVGILIIIHQVKWDELMLHTLVTLSSRHLVGL